MVIINPPINILYEYWKKSQYKYDYSDEIKGDGND
jgi:hypothetical protein